MIGKCETTGTGNHGMNGTVTCDGICFLKQTGQGLPDIGEMSLIVGKEDSMVLVQQNNLNSGGTDINAQCIILLFVHVIHDKILSL